MVKAIETVYKGYRFRSRLEARWAVFFDALGFKWEYEKEGYTLPDGTRYLPDFWLTERKCWIEIKGEGATEEEKRKCYALAESYGFPVYLLQGSCWPEESWAMEFYPESYPLGLAESDGFEAVIYERGFTEWEVCATCGDIGLWIAHDTCNCSCRFFDHPLDIGKQKKRLIDAYTAARQARFEHGEQPRFL